MRYKSMRYNELYAYEVHTYEVYTHEVHVREVLTRGMHAYETRAMLMTVVRHLVITREFLKIYSQLHRLSIIDDIPAESIFVEDMMLIILEDIKRKASAVVRNSHLRQKCLRLSVCLDRPIHNVLVGKWVCDRSVMNSNP
jgi:hypothetical protein